MAEAAESKPHRSYDTEVYLRAWEIAENKTRQCYPDTTSQEAKNFFNRTLVLEISKFYLT